MSTQQTYDKRVYSIAEKMRQRLIDTGDAQRLPDDAFIPILAVEAVKHMAEMAGSYLYSRFVREGYSGYDAEKLTQKELKFQGLIPDQEDGKDETPIN